MIEVIEAFTGYPDGVKPRSFAKGERIGPDDLPADFITMIVNKGHAVRAKVEKPK